MDQGNNITRSGLLALVTLVLCLALACGGGASSSSQDPGQPFASVTVAPSSISMARGNQQSSTLTTQVGGGFSGPLALSASGVPTGFTVTFDPPQVMGSGSSNVTVDVARGTPTGTYTIAISGSGGDTGSTTTLTVHVTAEVMLTWGPSPSREVAGYNVARSERSGGEYVALNSGLISGTSYIDDTVQSGRTYYYVAMAVSWAGAQSLPSNEAFAEVP